MSSSSYGRIAADESPRIADFRPLSGWSTLPRSFDLRNRGVRPPSCRLPVDLGCFSRPLFAFQSFEDALRLSSCLPDFR